MKTAIPDILQQCLDRMLRAEAAHTSPDARQELSDERHKLHTALVLLARAGRTVDALRGRASAVGTAFSKLDLQHAEDKRTLLLSHALDVARDCDRVRAAWEGAIVRNDNGAML